MPLNTQLKPQFTTLCTSYLKVFEKSFANIFISIKSSNATLPLQLSQRLWVVLARCVRQAVLVVHADCGVLTGGTLLSRSQCGCPTRGTFPAT